MKPEWNGRAIMRRIVDIPVVASRLNSVVQLSVVLGDGHASIGHCVIHALLPARPAVDSSFPEGRHSVPPGAAVFAHLVRYAPTADVWVVHPLIHHRPNSPIAHAASNQPRRSDFSLQLMDHQLL